MSQVNFSVAEAAEYLRIGRSQIYKLIRNGQLVPFKIGDRTLLTLAELERFVAAQQP